MNMSDQSIASGIHGYSQAYLPAVTSNCSHHGWTVIGICATSRSLVGPTTRWVERVKVLVTFFPPHSETSRRSQSVGPVMVYRAEGAWHCSGYLGGAPTRLPHASPAQLPTSLRARPSVPHATTISPAQVSDAVAQTLSDCTHCRVEGSVCTDRLSTGSVSFSESGRPLPLLPRTVGTSAHPGESDWTATVHILRCSGGLLLEIPCSLVYPNLHSFYS